MKRVRRAASITAIALVGACSHDREIAGTSQTPTVVHPSGIADPTSPAFHGALLRREHWAGMLDANSGDACGRCHDGSPAPVASVTSFALGATACTSCHKEPAGPLACTTCHAPAEAHAAHVAPSPASTDGLACSTCHPAPGTPVIGGAHGNGTVDVAFDPTFAANGAFDVTTRACAVACHDIGGARPRPRWAETTPMTCGDCHASPPKSHYAGACSGCHAEANATGTALARGALHMNGRIDVANGDAASGCASCHGSNGDPWPATGAHRLHESSALTAAVVCADCHVVPGATIAPGHLDGVAEVTFAARASAGGLRPTWDGATCSNVACHGANLAAKPAPTPAWRDALAPLGSCGACHGMPPQDHTASTSCERSNCHGAEVARDAMGILTITPAGRALHINGTIDHAAP